MKTRNEEVLEVLIQIIKSRKADDVILDTGIFYKTDREIIETKITASDLRDALWNLAEDLNLSRLVSQQLDSTKS